MFIALILAALKKNSSKSLPLTGLTVAMNAAGAVGSAKAICLYAKARCE